jgi:hypothetical protein
MHLCIPEIMHIILFKLPLMSHLTGYVADQSLMLGVCLQFISFEKVVDWIAICLPELVLYIQPAVGLWPCSLQSDKSWHPQNRDIQVNTPASSDKNLFEWFVSSAVGCPCLILAYIVKMWYVRISMPIISTISANEIDHIWSKKPLNH